MFELNGSITNFFHNCSVKEIFPTFENCECCPVTVYGSTPLRQVQTRLSVESVLRDDSFRRMSLSNSFFASNRSFLVCSNSFLSRPFSSFSSSYSWNKTTINVKTVLEPFHHYNFSSGMLADFYPPPSQPRQFFFFFNHTPVDFSVSQPRSR